jgi:hypothetical protein
MALDLKGMFSSFGLGSFDMSTIIDKVYFFGGIFLLFLIIGCIIGGLLYFRSKKKQNKDLVKIAWWEDTIAGMVPSRSDEAEEIIIPGTSLRVFYVKDRDLWLPRFTRGITKDLFYIAMTPTRQMVNFTLQSLGESLKDTTLAFDHTDMLWAAENTREFIKRNYKDKSIKWWQAYQGVITTAIYILILTFSFCLILYMMKGMIDKIGAVASTLEQALKQSCAAAFNSGVVAA